MTVGRGAELETVEVEFREPVGAELVIVELPEATGAETGALVVVELPEVTGAETEAL